MADENRTRLIALSGVPNVGKSTLFNQLTGLNQKVGNYPGITVDKKMGTMPSTDGHQIKILDLPGTYNLYPRSEDEQIVFRVLCGLEPNLTVDGILAVADMSNLERGLFLVTQLIDLSYPTALVLNMADQASDQGFQINRILLERLLGIPVFITTADKGQGIPELKRFLGENGLSKGKTSLEMQEIFSDALFTKVEALTGEKIPYRALQLLKFRNDPTRLDKNLSSGLNTLATEYKFNGIEAQRKETSIRYERVNKILGKCLKTTDSDKVNNTRRLDKIFLNRYLGFGIFMLILFAMFQVIFTWAQGPMEWIDQLFAMMSYETAQHLPAGALTDLLSEGIIPGLGGIVIFVPQIALLFALLAVLEGTGYMARAVFITDRMMRPFGLNGRSVVPLISGFACAIPAIMATRSISNRKDRFITIFVTPFMSCSARLPVYIMLIGLIIPEGEGSFIDNRGLALFGMYLLGIFAALASAWLMKVLMKREPSGSLVIELPRYRMPHLKTVLYTMYEKSKTFVVEAGKVILAVSIVLWVLASYGPGDRIAEAEASVPVPTSQSAEAEESYDLAVNTKRLEASYAGMIGQWMEPAIKPLGYDWKIGIALLTSFAAREVFIATIATLYSIGSEDEDYTTLQERLNEVRNTETGQPFFSPPVVWSLLVFYAFAMQCMSTVAVVYRETKSWRWPLAQTVYMTLVAYFSALAVYQFLS